MIQVDFSNATAERIGAEHGIDITAAIQEHDKRIRDSVVNLYATKDQTGGWRRWLNLPYDDNLYNQLEAYANAVRNQYTDLVVLGIGGSSLGGFALLKALLHPYWNDLSKEQRGGYPRFYFVENVDADQIRGLMDILNPETTLFNVISKSGTTAETMSAFMYVKDRLERDYGKEVAARNIVVTTDANKGILRNFAQTEGYQSFEVPDDVGGRFSVFSAVGLLPAVLCGVNIRQIQQGLQELDHQLQNPDVRQNPAAKGALLQYAAYQRGKNISVLMPYSARLAAVSDWYVQLWAESLGKKQDRNGNVVNVGPTPLKAVGVTDQHSQVQLYNEGPFDKIFTFVEVKSPDQDLTIPAVSDESGELDYLAGKTFGQLMSAEFQSTRASITRNQRPNVTITIPRVDGYHFAQLLYLLEVQTAIAGDLFEIDPFDQPGVELAKKYTYALMGRSGFEHLLEEASGDRNPVPMA